MSWSYSGNPSSSQLDELRFRIGDTDSTDPQLQNEELQYIIDDLTNNGSYNYLKGSIVALRVILAKYKSLVDEKVGDVDVKWSQKYNKVKGFLDMYIQQHAKTVLGGAYAGGISIASKSNREENSDRVLPAFVKDFGKSKRLTDNGIPQERSGSY